MLPLILAAFMSLPIYPLNPTNIDTVSSMNLHITAGMNAPSAVLSAGPDISAKYEFLFYHPFILRTAIDFRFGEISSPLYPEGDISRTTLSAEAIYYRGTDRMTGYFGFGLVFAMNSFDINDDEAARLFAFDGTTDVAISSDFGYRLTAGLRIKRIYSIEIGITEVSPSFVYTKDLGPRLYSVYEEQFRFNDFRISFGYLFNLK